VAVVILPFNCPAPADLHAELVGRGISSYVPNVDEIPADLPTAVADARRVALSALWLNQHEVPGQIIIVAFGDDARLLPALSLSQRSSHRLVSGYVIVDALAPAPASDWPDAPVTWVLTPDAPSDVVEKSLTARLRGFDVVENTAIDAIAAAVV